MIWYGYDKQVAGLHFLCQSGKGVADHLWYDMKGTRRKTQSSPQGMYRVRSKVCGSWCPGGTALSLYHGGGLRRQRWMSAQLSGCYVPRDSGNRWWGRSLSLQSKAQAGHKLKLRQPFLNSSSPSLRTKWLSPPILPLQIQERQGGWVSLEKEGDNNNNS